MKNFSELGSRGGRRRTGYRQDGLKEFAAPKTGADVRDLLAESIVELRAGKLDPKVANALGYLGTSLLRALEIADIEQRLGALEGNQESSRRGRSRSRGTRMRSFMILRPKGRLHLR